MQKHFDAVNMTSPIRIRLDSPFCGMSIFPPDATESFPCALLCLDTNVNDLVHQRTWEMLDLGVRLVCDCLKVDV